MRGAREDPAMRGRDASKYSAEVDASQERQADLIEKTDPQVRRFQVLSIEDEYSQNSTACVDVHRAAVQEQDTAHVKRKPHGAKRDRDEAAFSNSET